MVDNFNKYFEKFISLCSYIVTIFKNLASLLNCLGVFIKYITFNLIKFCSYQVLGNSFTTMIHWLIFALIFGLICGCIAYFYRIRMCGQQLLSQRFSLRFVY